MRWAGISLAKIAEAFGVTGVAVHHVVKDIPVQANKGRPRATPSSVTITPPTATSGRPRIQVPFWVERAALGDEYRELAAKQDEFAAASHCRALLREMRAGA